MTNPAPQSIAAESELWRVLSDLLTSEYEIRASELNTGNYPAERVRILKEAQAAIEAIVMGCLPERVDELFFEQELGNQAKGYNYAIGLTRRAVREKLR